MINMINQKKGDEWFWFKMVMQENPKLTSSHGYTRSTAPYGYLLWEGKKPSKTRWTNIHTTRAPGAENLLEEIMAKNVYNLGKDRVLDLESPEIR